MMDVDYFFSKLDQKEMTDTEAVTKYLKDHRKHTALQIQLATDIPAYRVKVALTQLRALGIIWTELGKPSTYELAVRHD